jgi:hypothetical protein
MSAIISKPINFGMSAAALLYAELRESIFVCTRIYRGFSFIRLVL